MKTLSVIVALCLVGCGYEVKLVKPLEKRQEECRAKYQVKLPVELVSKLTMEDLDKWEARTMADIEACVRDNG